MPRSQRVNRPNQCYHIMLRGVGGERIFFEDAEKVRFCLLLQAASEKHDFKIHAFCLMDNHLHFILEPISSPISNGIHAFSFRYAQYFNKRHKRCGYLYQGRFKAIMVEDGLYLKRLTRYIHLNPVEAGLSKEPEGYKWSSHKAYLGKADYFWLHTERVLSHFSSNREEALLKFREFFHHHGDFESEKNVIAQAISVGIFGSEGFVESLSSNEQNFTENSLEISFKKSLEFVCKHFDVSLEQLTSSDRSKQSVDARSILALAARKAKDWTVQDVANYLGKNSGTLSRLAARASNDPQLSSLIEELL